MNQTSTSGQRANVGCAEAAEAKFGNQDFQSDSMARLTIAENKVGYLIEIDLPGVPRDAIVMTIEGGVLEVTGSREEPNREGYRKVFSDREFCRFRRAVRLPEDADLNAIDATLSEGVLHVSLPRIPEAQPRRIEIRVPSA